MTAMPLWRFLLWTFLGSAIWNVILGGAGYYLGTRFAELDRYVAPVGIVLMAAAVIVYVYRVVTWHHRRGH
jgi:membrane protein DedA with SNARE-associated domain